MLAQEVITLALRPTASIQDVLTAALALAEEVGDADAIGWINEELHGYALVERVPQYRRAQQVPAYIDYEDDEIERLYPKGPTWELGRWGPRHGEFGAKKVALKDSAPVIEKLGRDAGNLEPAYSTRLPDGAVVSDTGSPANLSYRIVERFTLVEVVEQVLKRVLDWASSAEKRKPQWAPARPRRKVSASSRVFIVHGHNHAVRDAIDLYLTKDLGVRTLIMHAGSSGGRTLPEKLEEISRDTSFAIFIMTADDQLTYAGTNKTIRRARQNVILEIGYFWALLGRRDRVVFLIEQNPDMELPSDLDGLELIPITADLGQTKLQLKNELEKAGIVK